MRKLLDKYRDIIHKPTYVKSEYQKCKVYKSDQNLKEITTKVDNKSVNKNSDSGYLLTTSVKTFRCCKFAFIIKIELTISQTAKIRT